VNVYIVFYEDLGSMCDPDIRQVAGSWDTALKWVSDNNPGYYNMFVLKWTVDGSACERRDVQRVGDDGPWEYVGRSTP